MKILDSLNFWDRTQAASKTKAFNGVYTPFYYNSATGELTGDFRPTNGSLQGSFKNCPPIFTAVDWVASKVSQCPLLIYNINNKSKFYDYKQYSQEQNLRSLQKSLKYKSSFTEIENENDPLKQFFKKPNPFFSLKQLNYIYVIS